MRILVEFADGVHDRIREELEVESDEAAEMAVEARCSQLVAAKRLTPGLAYVASYQFI